MKLSKLKKLILENQLNDDTIIYIYCLEDGTRFPLKESDIDFSLIGDILDINTGGLNE